MIFFRLYTVIYNMALPIAVAMAGLGAALMNCEAEAVPEKDSQDRPEGRAPPEVTEWDGKAPLDYRKTPPAQPFDPVRAEFEVNQVCGRPDNLPRLRSVMKDSKYELQPWHGSMYDYANLRKGNTYLENQLFHRNLTPNETPLSYGALPNVKKSTGLQLRDPDTPDMLKPKRKETETADLFMPTGDTLASRYEPVTWKAHQRAIEQSKLNSGRGALDGFSHLEQPGSGAAGPTRGFAGGEVMTPRHGGFHPRERFFRVPETRRGRNQHALRPLNPEPRVGKLGSMYLSSTAPLGRSRHNRNHDVLEWHRAPERTGGIRQIDATPRNVEMKFTNRDTGLCLQRKPRRKEGMMGRQAPLQYDPDEY